MKKKKNLLFVVSLALVIVMSLGGCSDKFKKPDIKQQDGEQVKVVAQVNGTDILYSEFYDTLSYYASMYGIDLEGEIEEESQKEMLEDLKEQALNEIIDRAIVIQKAEEAGFVVDDEAISKATEQFNEIIARIADDIKNSDESEDSETSDDGERDYTKEALEKADKELAEIGKTKDSYINEVAQYNVMQSFIDSIMKDVEATDDDIRDYYDEQLENQRKNGVSPWGGDIPLIQQEAGRRVKHILIGLDGENTIDDIKPKAEEVLEKARNGEDFEALIEEYGEDPGMKGNDTGYIVAANGKMVPEFESASLALEDGQISDLVESQFGYHIIKSYGNAEEIVFSFEDKKAELSEGANQKKKSDFYSQKIEEWKAASTINKFLENI